jgi:murein DD-endopeptidase MepM/ murein hydrolase activator NlpD
MAGWDQELEAITSLRMPSDNALTDLFGFDRKWGFRAWRPSSLYSPIHAGIDLRARPKSTIVSPADGWVWGDMVGGSVGSYVLIRPILEDRSPSQHVLLLMMHCQPTGARWRHARAGDRITEQASHGIGAPHLHYEINVSAQFGRVLQMERLISADAPLTDTEWRRKAREAQLSPRAALREVRAQCRRWGIREVHMDHFIRGPLPDYRRSQHSEVGRGETWVVDPLALSKRKGEVT